MLKSNLIELLSKLDPKEFRELGEFVNSPFFNKNQSVIKLYEYISKYYPDFPEDDFGLKTVFTRLFPGTVFKEGFMRTIMFNLSRLVEDYLSYVNYANDPYIPKFHLLNELYSRRVEGMFQKKFREANETLEGRLHDAKYFRSRYDLVCIERLFRYIRMDTYSEKKYSSQDFKEQADYLLNYFLLELLSDYRASLNASNVINLNFDFSTVDYILKIIDMNPEMLINPLTKLHYYEVMLLKEPGKENYLRLKQLFMAEHNSLDQLTKFGTMTVLLNFTILQYFNGERAFMRERFELFKFQLGHRLYTKSKEGFFSEGIFESIFDSAVLNKEFDWAGNFIKEYKNSIPEEYRDNLVNYTLGKLCFGRKDFEGTANYLSKVTTPKYIALKYRVKNLSLMQYYETNMFEPAFDAIDAYRHFITNEKITHELRRERQSNFMRFYKELLNIKSGKNSRDIDEVRSRFEESKNIANFEWVEEKIKELESTT